MEIRPLKIVSEKTWSTKYQIFRTVFYLADFLAKEPLSRFAARLSAIVNFIKGCKLTANSKKGKFYIQKGKKTRTNAMFMRVLAEAVGFEPTRPCGLPDFEPLGKRHGISQNITVHH